MNKQRYLGELQSLLVFMTEEDRELAIRHYGNIFDAVGEDGAEALVRSLGSPTKSAIALSRGYEPGSIKNLPQAPASVQKARAALTQTQDDPWGDLPTFEVPAITEEKAETVPPEAETPKAEMPKAEMPKAERPVEFQKDDAELPSEPEPMEPEAYYERSMSLGIGIPLLILVMLAIGVPLAALVLALAAVCLAPGAAVLFGAWLVAVGGLWCLAYMADAVLLFGAALLVLAIGLVVLWGGLWLASRLVLLYTRGVQWLCGELLGRKVTDNE